MPGKVCGEFSATKPLDRALLISTTDAGFTGNRKWHKSSATLEKQGHTWLVTTTQPPATTARFANVRRGDLTASSDYQVTK